mgnify:CR=1 FL=1
MKDHDDKSSKNISVFKSMNTLQNRAKILKLMPLLSYFLIWLIGIIAFWFFTGSGDAMGYALVFFWFIYPIAAFVCSLFAAINKYKNINKLLTALLIGAMYMLADYATFKMANNITFDKVNAPDFSLMLAGTAVSAAGMLIGRT